MGYRRATSLTPRPMCTSRRDGGRERQPGQPVHHMWLRLTIDLDLKIHDVEAVTDTGPCTKPAATSR